MSKSFLKVQRNLNPTLFNQTLACTIANGYQCPTKMVCKLCI